MSPAFSFRHIKDLFPTYWNVSLDMVRAIEMERDPETGIIVVEPNDWGSRVTLDVLGRAGLGTDFGALKDPNNKLTSAYRSVFEQTWIDIVWAICEITFGADLVISLP